MERTPKNSSKSGQGTASGNTVAQGADSLSLIWDTIVSDPSTGVTLIDEDGRVLFINEPSVRIFLPDGFTPAQVMGKTITELEFPEQWVNERLAILDQLKGSTESVLLRTVWQGRQQFSWMRHIPSEDSLDRRIFW